MDQNWQRQNYMWMGTVETGIGVEIIALWLEIMHDEELIRLQKRVSMRMEDIGCADAWRNDKRKVLISLFEAEIKRRNDQPEKTI